MLPHQMTFRFVQVSITTASLSYRMQKFEVKESCEILDKYLTMRWQHPTWFQNLDCRVSPEFK